jgi:2-oxoglutarate dehydrogenase E1 component
VLHDHQRGEIHIPLNHLQPQQERFTVIDSVLSEEGVVGFEYGYATTEPNTLVIWEAQFGDFVNGAQVVIDQFISSGEQKWGRLCGLVMFLPHGYEGQGPEHSSARLERFLQLSAQQNMQICVPTTPAQVFHMLRRQMLRLYRKPLITLTPKSLLRHRLATSTLEDLSQGAFQWVIPEIDAIATERVRRVVFCTGKVFYDLLQQRRNQGIDDVAIARIEQLYPFPHEQVQHLTRHYPNASEIIWCQEEPQNQGAWYGLQPYLNDCLMANQTLHYVGRNASASPATGYAELHAQQQQRLVQQALTSSS